MTDSVAVPRSDFIRDIVAADLEAGRVETVVTRFPPEPNGYLHIGHAKSICLNFGVAREFGGRCNLRFDDTNPVKEEQEYLDAIEADVRWLGFDWGDGLFHASDYFEQLYDWAVHLIREGLAFVDDQTADEIRETRGTLTAPGAPSPFRDRAVDENLDLFARMRAGEFATGARVLRAKIDMASPNMNLRDPVLYRIVHATHPRTGDAWCIYPTYDFAHGQSDAIEGVTHSLCTLEFENHRPLYDWLIEHLPVPSRPHQYEFARLNLTHTVLSKRVLKRLVDEGHVRGWDDPRMPTLAGLRRRGFPPEGIRDFATMIGVAKTDSVIEFGQLEFAVRAVLNRTSPRRFAVLDPIKVVIANYPDGQLEEMEVGNNPEDPSAGTRKVPFSRDAVDRARGLRRGATPEVLPAFARPRGPPAERVLHHLRRGHQGRRRHRRRAPLHVRPGDTRRRLARRSAPQGDAPLGIGRARDPGRGAPVRPPVPVAEPGRRRHGPVRRPEPRVRGDPAGGVPGTRARRCRRGHGRAVRAPGLLRGRPGHRRRSPGLGAHPDPQGHLGEGPGARLNAHQDLPHPGPPSGAG